MRFDVLPMLEIGKLRVTRLLCGYEWRQICLLFPLMVRRCYCLLNLSRFYQGFLAFLPNRITQANARESSVRSLMLRLAVLKAWGTVRMNAPRKFWVAIALIQNDDQPITDVTVKNPVKLGKREDALVIAG